MNPTKKLLIVLAVLAVHGAHPLLHAFEGGTLDAILLHLDVFAARFAQETP
jgi:hypothetical protein